MKAAPFDYAAPTTLSETLDLLQANAGAATVLAGGQTLMPLLALRLSLPLLVIDINRVEGLAGVTQNAGAVRLGAMTRQAALLDDGVLAETLAPLPMAARHIGHYQTRNRGTIGGSVCLGEPAAELPATCVALGAAIEAHSKRGVRTIAAEHFYTGPYTTTLEPDELTVAVNFPDWAGARPLFCEVTRRPGDFALVGLVGALAVDDGVITRAGLAWFGMGPTPMKARQAEASLLGQSAADIDVRAVAELALADADPFSDSHASAEYRRTVGARVLARTLTEALGR